MAVYIDNSKMRYGRMLMSHMWSPDLEELNEIADRVGIQRKWLQDKHPYFIHYDLCQSKRDLAIKHGAIPVSTRDLVKMASPNFDFTEEDLKTNLKNSNASLFAEQED